MTIADDLETVRGAILRAEWLGAFAALNRIEQRMKAQGIAIAAAQEALGTVRAALDEVRP